MEYDFDNKVTAFKNTFSKVAKSSIDNKNYILDYCLTKRAWKDAVIREKFNSTSTIIKNKLDIIAILKKELVGNIVSICDNYDAWHDRICNITDYGMRYGVWQKFINMVFKNLYCVNKLFSGFKDIWSKCHCPIDTKIARVLNEKLNGLNIPTDELELSYKFREAME